MNTAIIDMIGFLNLNWQNAVMLAAACVLLWLGIARRVEPVLLVPVGAGCLLANIPLGGVAEAGGFLSVLAGFGISLVSPRSTENGA